MSTLPGVLAALLGRIERMGEPPAAYNVIGILETITQDYGVTVADVTDGDFLRLLVRHQLEDQTNLPCPAWCRSEAGHRFESYNPLTGRQSRPHSLKLAAGEGHYVALVQEEEREKGDDSTSVLGVPVVSVEIEGDFDAAELRKRAADLLNAADKLEEINASRG